MIRHSAMKVFAMALWMWAVGAVVVLTIVTIIIRKTKRA
jgi:hypothetical protein